MEDVLHEKEGSTIKEKGKRKRALKNKIKCNEKKANPASQVEDSLKVKRTQHIPTHNRGTESWGILINHRKHWVESYTTKKNTKTRKNEQKQKK